MRSKLRMCGLKGVTLRRVHGLVNPWYLLTQQCPGYLAICAELHNVVCVVSLFFCVISPCRPSFVSELDNVGRLAKGLTHRLNAHSSSHRLLLSERYEASRCLSS